MKGFGKVMPGLQLYNQRCLGRLPGHALEGNMTMGFPKYVLKLDDIISREGEQ